MIRSRTLLMFLPLWLMAAAALAQVSPVPTARQHGPSPEVEPYQSGEQVELYRLRIVNDAGGAIAASRDGGATWETLGHVVTYTTKVAREGYTASKWAPMSAVAATAVNAIHIRTGYNAEKDRGVVFSLLPQELGTAAGRKLASFLSPDASILTDIPGGTQLFGGHWAPILGNPVAREAPEGLQPLPENYVPQQGDVFVIRVLQPANTPKAIIFENRFGGFITVQDWQGHEQVIGQVLKPVAGVGRFTGSQYTDVGHLRANHSGVICISTSPLGSIGGFQIVPREHAMSPEMTQARTLTQWMVVGPLDAREPSWEGVAPLFRGYLRPAYAANDWDGPDNLRRLLDRTSVDVRINDGPWQPMPAFSFDPDLSKPLPTWCMSALANVSAIRVQLPAPPAVVTELEQHLAPLRPSTPAE